MFVTVEETAGGDVDAGALFDEFVYDTEVAGMPIVVRFRVNTQPSPPTVLPGLESYFRRLGEALDASVEDAPLAALRRGALDEVDAPPALRTVLEKVMQVREATGGMVDPWRSPEGFLFRGWFRGWLAQQVRDRCETAGYWDLHITFGPVDLFSGQMGHSVPWRVQVPNPGGEGTFEYVPAAAGTLAVAGPSSTVLHPGTLEAAPAGRTVAVYGPDGGMADAFAAAIIAGGVETAEWLMSRNEGYGLLYADGGGGIFGWGDLAEAYQPSPAPY